MPSVVMCPLCTGAHHPVECDKAKRLQAESIPTRLRPTWAGRDAEVASILAR